MGDPRLGIFDAAAAGRDEVTTANDYLELQGLFGGRFLSGLKEINWGSLENDGKRQVIDFLKVLDEVHGSSQSSGAMAVISQDFARNRAQFLPKDLLRISRVKGISPEAVEALRGKVNELGRSILNTELQEGKYEWKEEK